MRPQKASEAEAFLRDALKHISGNLILYSMPRGRQAACRVIREAIFQLHRQQQHEQLIERIREVVPGFTEKG